MQENKIALIFVGMPGSGKSASVEHLKKFGFKSVYFGKITLDELKKRNLEVNEENERLVREDIRKKEGKGAYAIRVLSEVEDLFQKGEDIVIVESLYSWTEYRIFKETLGDRAIVIALISPREERHKRLMNRKIRPLTKEEAESRDYAEIENLEKGGPIANADYYLANEKDELDLTNDLDKLLQKLGINIKDYFM